MQISANDNEVKNGSERNTIRDRYIIAKINSAGNTHPIHNTLCPSKKTS